MSQDLPKIALVGLDPTLAEVAKGVVTQCQFVDQAYDDSLFEGPVGGGNVAVLLCGMPPEGMSATEVAQSLRMNHPVTPIYFLTNARDSYHRKNLLKNGFTDSFLIPNDQPVLKSTLSRDIAIASKGQIKSYRTVQLVDVVPGQTLGFDLYVHLPANNRYIKFASGAQPLDEARAQRLAQSQIQSGHVTEDQMHEFYRFTANQLKNLDANSTISETEKKERREKAVRDLLSGIFSEANKDDTISAGRGLMSDCQEILKAYIVDPSTGKGSFYDKLLSLTSDTNSPYGRAADVASLSAMLVIGLGLGDPEEIALAGLLHDIGLADVPLEVCMKDAAERTPEEEAEYRKHPELSVNIIKERKMIVSEKVMKYIVQHHERFNGSGYPKGLAGPRVCPEAQILAIADLIISETAPREGKPRRTPMEVVEEIFAQAMGNPSAAQFDPELLRKMIALFPQKQKEADKEAV